MHHLKKTILTAALAALLTTPIVTTSQLTPFEPVSSTTAAAKTVSRKTVTKAIKSTPDLNPTSKVRHFATKIYVAYYALFNKNYNVERMSKPGVFKHHQATIYIPSDQLKKSGFVTAAMKNWNTALGTTVFRLGTAKNHTITVALKQGPTSGNNSWDGYYKTNKVYVNSLLSSNADYVPAVYEDLTGQKMASADDPSSTTYYEQYQKYWTAVITHELGHSLGLDHTPYANDMMASEFESASSDFKYSWNNYKDKQASFAILTDQLSTRDINRAKLTKIIGYW
ncbi:hypothetical protein YK48G_05100 [Lentilactobacillus fungorum]|uniref:Peptidase M10 metallopeptidase domain-containing protein n=1 Tax=Lentilactobacillus fungorum TaxID=2201250 RepID=A0ABQ3VW18_9LACO|nr:matrixin family metalloprotease [Lentilactobacillus fungorum]GHP13085.1 hypothetical protein YK48G_05100 [Lentilactobacillus fungorum]